jgi:hypothetical protein
MVTLVLATARPRDTMTVLIAGYYPRDELRMAMKAK